MREKKNQERGIPGMIFRTGRFGIFCGAIYMAILAAFMTGCTKDEVNVPSGTDLLKTVGIVETLPVNLADSVSVDPIVTVTFKSGTNPSEISAATITLKNGTNNVPGTLAVTGDTLSFTPEADLAPDKEYTATLKTSKKGGSGPNDGSEYTWRFKTGKHHRSEEHTSELQSP
jgi:hypothetical protein